MLATSAELLAEVFRPLRTTTQQGLRGREGLTLKGTSEYHKFDGGHNIKAYLRSLASDLAACRCRWS
jgi:hypothetical protein